MIFAKSASRYSAVRPRGGPRWRSHQIDGQKPMILPLGSLNSFGVYGTIHTDDQLARRLDVLGNGTGDIVDPWPPSPPWSPSSDPRCPSWNGVHPDIARTPEMASTAVRATIVSCSVGLDIQATTLSLLSDRVVVRQLRHRRQRPWTQRALPGNGTVRHG